MKESDYTLATALANLRGANHLLQQVIESEFPLHVGNELRVLRIKLILLTDNIERNLPPLTTENEFPEGTCKSCGIKPSEAGSAHCLKCVPF